MKKFLALTAMLVLLTSTSAFAAISGSSHDFVAGSYTFTTEICAPCHTPHNAIAGAGPLWSHSSADSTTFTMYTVTVNSATAATEPRGVSLACLSCHDGVTDMDAFIGGGFSGTLMTGSAALGQDLSNDHPIGMGYTVTTGYKDISASVLPLYDDGGTDKVECATCHEVHNDSALGSMLRIDNAGSNLCIECHDK